MVKMTLSKTVTQQIVKAWAKGLTAEETVKFLKDECHVDVCLNTVYAKRKSLDASEMIEELMREQLREIVIAPDLAVRLKYRDKILDKLMPRKPTVAIENNVKVENEVPANVNPQDLREYNRIIQELAEAEGREAAETVQRNSDAKPVPDAQASDSEGAQSSN